MVVVLVVLELLRLEPVPRVGCGDAVGRSGAVEACDVGTGATTAVGAGTGGTTTVTGTGTTCAARPTSPSSPCSTCTCTTSSSSLRSSASTGSVRPSGLASTPA